MRGRLGVHGDPAALSAWFGADAWLEPEPGGIVLFRFADGSVRRGEVEEVRRDRLLRWRWREHRGAGFGLELSDASTVCDRARADRGRDARADHRDRGGGRRALVPGGWRVMRRTNAVFQALADPTRREVLRSLSASGPSTLAELSSRMPISRQAVAKHLSVLAGAGLVAGVGEVRGRRYRVTPRPLADAMDWMVDVGAGWDERLARLKRQVESGS